MGKQSGSSNYKMAEVDRLLQLVEKYLPLGKDEWERLTNDYNATRPRSWNERDTDSIRRKFKAMYGARKPSGKGNIPPHIDRAKELKRAVDQKASVIEMDDCADEDSDDEPDQEKDEELEDDRPISPDFSFDYVSEDTLFHDRGGDGSAALSGGSFSAFVGNEAPTGSEGVKPFDDGEAMRAVNSGEVLSHLDVRVGVEGLEAFTPPAQTNPSPSDAAPTRTLRSAGLRKPKKPRTTSNNKPKSARTGTIQQPKPTEAGRTRITSDSNLQASSNRLGGGDLRAFRDSLWSKRSTEDGDLDSAEASFAKTKRVRAQRATEVLSQKLSTIQSVSSGLSGSIMEMVLLLREENEMKAETRRADEEQRRRDEVAAREERYQVEKREAEERRRQDNLEREERARRDREEARARTQELAMLLGVLKKAE
ncbi:hypothetical protein AM587_10011880 [Phytophthora nicotianae]|uniref:DUF6818 domain-containing protein n=1 Tax=Phytophthora nicotianae TaxID=4792 RepID=A0A0W8CXL8_PHYNI|nr:hypothetical protein AM587_10011880 [Phytophthora nicotianae]